MKLIRGSIAAVAVAGLLAFTSSASAQWHGHGGGSGHGHGGWHGHPGWGGPRFGFAIGFPFFGWGYPAYGYPAYGYGYGCPYPPPYYAYCQPPSYTGRVVSHGSRDSKDVQSEDK